MEVGYKMLTETGAVGTSGQPIAIYGWSFASSATDDKVELHDGTDTFGTLVMTIPATVSQDSLSPLPLPNTQIGGVGVVFPNGCYAVISGTSKITFFVREI